MKALALAAAAVIVLTAACSEESGPQSAPTPGSEPSAAPTTTDDVMVQTDVGPLPAPATLADLQRRTVGMPDTVGGAGRVQSAPEQVRYVSDAIEFGIEVSEVGDLYPDVSTPAEAFPRLGEQLSGSQSCAQPPSYCLRGTSDGQPTVVWGHDGSPLVFVALAPDEATLTDLLDAWQAAG